MLYEVITHQETEVAWSFTSPDTGTPGSLLAAVPVFTRGTLVGIWAVELPPRSIELIWSTDRLMQDQVTLLLSYNFV